MQLRDWFFGLFGRRPRTEDEGLRTKGPATHIIILDGTMSSLVPEQETNAGLTYKLLLEAGRRANLTLHYEAGIQWRYWRNMWDVMTGRGINRQIARAYGVLASRYRPGDRIVLIGYSRGAYAVRSLAGAVDLIGKSIYKYMQFGGDTSALTAEQKAAAAAKAPRAAAVCSRSSANSAAAKASVNAASSFRGSRTSVSFARPARNSARSDRR